MPSIIRGVDDFDSLESQGLGDGQTWQDLTASRSGGVTYTNSTGRPILIRIRIRSSAAGSFDSSVTLNGSLAVSYNRRYASGAGGYYYENVIVPNGFTYKVDAVDNSTVFEWWELR